MSIKAWRRAFAVTLLTGIAGAGLAQGDTVSYRLKPAGADDAVTIERGDLRAAYRPVFTVIRAEQDPRLALSGFASTPGEPLKDVNAENYPLPGWRRPSDGTRTDSIFEAGKSVEVTASGSRTLPDGGVAWSFPAQRDFTLTAELHPVAGAAPRLSWTLIARTPGWYTVGYTGGPSVDPARADGFLQPLIWQEKRFPRAPLLTAESMGGLPVTLVTRDGVTGGVSVDPAESPFRLPTIANARFGVMLRNRAGQAQPSAFAPLLGQADSHLAAGQQVSFAVRPVLVAGDWYAAFTEVARGLFGFGDMRENVDQSLNATIEAMTDFAMNDAYSGWDADLKGFDYNTDVKGTVKVVSALHPLAAALIQDDPEIYRRRALPMTEFLMSRTKYLYNADPAIAGQNAARDMKGPAAEVSELADLYQMSRGASPVFRSYALALAGKPRALNLLMVSSGDTFWDKLALYRLTGDKSELAAARAGADRYITSRIDTAQTNFADVHLDQGGQFWADFAPRWVELYELWEETREPRYLAAAAKGARLYASYAWYFPAIPARDITVDLHDAPIGLFNAKPGAKPIRTPPQTLPAWRVSQIGLTPEAQTTYALNPGIFLAHQAAYELRIGAAVRDTFLHDVGRAAVVGRYKTYPGYDINVAYSNVYARADYPYRPFAELNHNEIYYNHVWPQIALLTDFLVSDVETRSNGAIAFPSRYAQGYAYLKSKVYGDRPGRFMGDQDVRLWMPRGLLRIDEPQVNYLSGYGNNRVYLALANQSHGARTAMVTLDKERLPFVPGRRYVATVWRDGRPAGTTEVVDGRVSVSVSADGLTALAIEGMPVFTRLQGRYFDAPTATPGERSFRTDTNSAGSATAMLLSLAGEREFYLWTSTSDADVKEARLTVFGRDGEQHFSDARHPFEFSIPWPGTGPVAYRLMLVRKDGGVVDGGRHEVSP